MRYLLLFFLFFTLIISNNFASTKTSVIDGNWSNPNTWSPVGVPFAEDTLIINSHVFADIDVDFGANWLIINNNDSLTGDSIFGLHGNLKNDGIINLKVFAVGDGTTTVNNGIIKGDNYATGNTTYDNYGTILSDTLSVSETPFINYSILSNTNLSTSGDFDNRGSIDVSSLFTQSGTFLNKSGAFINATGQLIISGNYDNKVGGVMVIGTLTTSNVLTNNGDISCNTWTHGSGTATGSTGKFCVASCFINSASITGTVDICDATPSTFCDINSGSIAGTVTYCTASPCAITVDIAESIKSETIKIYPNPVKNHLNIESKNIITKIEIFDISGKLIMEPNTNLVSINLSELLSGIYYIRIETENKVTIEKIIK